MSESIPFKTSSAPVTVVVLPENNLSVIEQAIADKMTIAPTDFFAAQPVVVDISDLTDFVPEVNWLNTLKRLFARYQLTLIGIIGEVKTEDLISTGLTTLAVVEPKPVKIVEKIVEKVVEKPVGVPTPIPVERCKVIRSPIRSGQQVYAQGSDLVIIGTVGAGAEVYADGNIHVYGALRGRAFAGVRNASKDAFIYCHEFSAELVSIAGFYQDMEQLQIYEGKRNVLITLNDDETMKIEAL